MKQHIWRLLAVITRLGLGATIAGAAQETKTFPDHPGNIFLVGDEVRLALPGEGRTWRLCDYEGQKLGDFTANQLRLPIGRLPVGFYRLEQTEGSNWISLAVLEPSRKRTPATSPIGIDVAMAWFYGPERVDAVAHLCSLAGVNWVRDRLNWAEMEKERGEFSPLNKYDASARAQSRAGLQVLQVMHRSPAWANPDSKRFPTDLRDAYRFFEAMAKRWRGHVQAFEPWNEADIPMFGGHTGAEMASLQKAAYLGLKAGNPKVIACLNVFALHQTNHLADLHENEAWPYFDTYNFHHYEPLDHYPKLYADHRAVSAGRPLWVSECAVAVKWAGEKTLQEPTDTDLRVQAERLVKTFASSLHEGSAATFYFMLPHYVEGQTQFGILRPDLTPRPAYVALAAVGRLLANAQPLGKLAVQDNTVRAFAFRARPDSKPRNVLVAWSSNGTPSLSLPEMPSQIFDHLGREKTVSKDLTLSPAPVFIVLPGHSPQKLRLVPPPPLPVRLDGKPCTIVLQSLWPEAKTDLKHSAYSIPSQQKVEIPIYAYNFGPQSVSGRIAVENCSGCEASLAADVFIAPMERKELALVLNSTALHTNDLGKVRLYGDFGHAGKAVLSVWFVNEASRPTRL